MSTSLHAMSTHFFTFYDGIVIGIWLEGFLYGKLYVLCAYNLSNYYSQRLYSGIFFMYLKCQSNKSRKATIVFYALYVLYVPTIILVWVSLGLSIDDSDNKSFKEATESLRFNNLNPLLAVPGEPEEWGYYLF